MTEKTPRVSLDPAPLIAVIEGQGEAPAKVCRHHGVPYRSYLRWKAKVHGVGLIKADEASISLGYHPAELFGEEWWQATA